MKISGAQVKAARDLLKITRAELAEASGVGERTLKRFEGDESLPKPASVDRVLSELQRRGIEFTNGTGIGLRLDTEKAAEFARTEAARLRKKSDP